MSEVVLVHDGSPGGLPSMDVSEPPVTEQVGVTGPDPGILHLTAWLWMGNELGDPAHRRSQLTASVTGSPP